jgi:hypothetical protein
LLIILLTFPSSPNKYSILNTLSGTHNVGTGQEYTTLGAAVAAYNTLALTSCNVPVDGCTLPSETFPITINSNTGQCNQHANHQAASSVTSTISGSVASSIFN